MTRLASPPRRAASSGTAERFALAVRSRRRRRGASLVAGVLLVLALVWLVVFSSWLRVRTVEVRGLDRVSASELAPFTQAEQGRAMALVDVSGLADQVSTVRLVRQVEVSRHWPSTLVVTVHERVPVAAVPDAAKSHYQLVDADGVEVEVVSQRPAALPYLDVNVATAGPGAMKAALDVQASLPAAVAAAIGAVGATSPDGVWFDFRNGARVTWGDSAAAAVKSDALVALVKAHPAAASYDVSAPSAPAAAARTLQEPVALQTSGSAAMPSASSSVDASAAQPSAQPSRS